MKKLFYTMVLLFGVLNLVQAQRMLPGQKGLEICAGVLSDENPGRNYYLNVGMTVNGKGGNYQFYALEYNHQYYNYKGIRIPQECYTAEGGYSFYLFGDAGKNVSINAGITAVAGYEIINRGKQSLFDGAVLLNEDNFIYGAGGKLSLETYLSDRLVLLIQGRIKVLWGTSLEQFRPSAGLGLRFNF
jgi:Conjugative transposon protein TraO